MKRNVSNLTEEDWEDIKNWFDEGYSSHCPGIDCEKCNDLFPGAPMAKICEEKHLCPCNHFGQVYVYKVVEEILIDRRKNNDSYILLQKEK